MGLLGRLGPPGRAGRRLDDVRARARREVRTTTAPDQSGSRRGQVRRTASVRLLAGCIAVQLLTVGPAAPASAGSATGAPPQGPASAPATSPTATNAPATSPTATSPTATSAPATGADRPVWERPLAGDDRPLPVEQRRRELRDAAVLGLLAGDLTPAADTSVVQVPGRTTSAGSGRPLPTSYAQTAHVGTDQVLALLVDLGSGDAGDATWNGPVHGDLPAPDRRRDEVSVDVSAAAGGTEPDRYDRLLFGADGSLASYLDEQSGGRFTVEGDVHGWLRVPGNAATYGRATCAAATCPDRSAALVGDAVEAFVSAYYAREPAGDLAGYLARFDRRDRYDRDADGVLDEPDGLVDHLVVVFAGAGEAAGARTDALASGFGHAVGTPALDPSAVPAGVPVGSSGIAVDTYTVQPEDAPLGTFAHLFGHDLGLADLADPSGQGETGVGAWSLMGSGHQLGDAGGLGTTPAGLLAWERLQLGWVVATAVGPGGSATVALRPAGPAGPGDGQGDDGATTVYVPLPATVREDRPARPIAGDTAFRSAAGPSADAVLSRPVATEQVVTWSQWLDTEPGHDTLRVQAAVGAGWVDLVPPATGRVGWRARSARLPDGATTLRFVYATDLVRTGRGVLVDDVRLDGGAELETGWTTAGWAAGDGTAQTEHAAAYLVEERAYAGADVALEHGPFVVDLDDGARATSRFPYSPGVLVTMLDTRWPDAAVGLHPDGARLLVVDARPEPVRTTGGRAAPAGIGPADAAFSRAWSRGFAVPASGRGADGEVVAATVRLRAQPPVPVFDDADSRWAVPAAGQPVIRPSGAQVEVLTTQPGVPTSVRVTGVRPGGAR